MVPGPRTRLVAIIGDPVRHSLSPAMHNAAFAALGLDWAYLAFEVPEGRAHEAVAGARALGLVGLSVTMPHKAAVVDAVDRLSPVAAALNAVNTVVRRSDDVLEGDNTDGIGFLDSVRQDEGFEPSGQQCLVVGAGGAARAVVKALADAGASEVVVVNRTPGRAAAAAALGGAVGRVGVMAEAADADLIVNATPMGMTAGARHGADVLSIDRSGVDSRADHGGNETSVVDPAYLGPGQLVVDLVYHPLVTPLLEAARSRGATGVSGLGMLIHQAAHAVRLWTGEDPPLGVMSAAALGALAK